MTVERENQVRAEREICGLINGLAKQIEAHVRARAATLGLTFSQAVALRERLRATLPIEPDGSIHLTARAGAVRGTA